MTMDTKQRTDGTNQREIKPLSIATYAKAPHAIYAGQPVRIHATGDLEGFSPAFQIVDENGRSQWVRQSEVQIIDLDYLPVSPAALAAVTQALGGRR